MFLRHKKTNSPKSIQIIFWFAKFKNWFWKHWNSQNATEWKRLNVSKCIKYDYSTGMSPSVFNPWKKKIMIEVNLKAMRQQKKNANSLSRRVSSSIFKIFVISIHWWWRKKFCLWLATYAESTRQHKARTFLPHSFLFQLDETVAIHLRT